MNESNPRPPLDLVALDAALSSLGLEQRITIKSALLRAGLLPPYPPAPVQAQSEREPTVNESRSRVARIMATYDSFSGVNWRDVAESLAMQLVAEQDASRLATSEMTESESAAFTKQRMDLAVDFMQKIATPEPAQDIPCDCIGFKCCMKKQGTLMKGFACRAQAPVDEAPKLSPKEREFCEWMIGFNSDPKFVQEFTTRFIDACNERVLKGGYPIHRVAPVHYVGVPAPAEYSETCTVCGAAVKPDGTCASCGQVATGGARVSKGVTTSLADALDGFRTTGIIYPPDAPAPSPAQPHPESLPALQIKFTEEMKDSQTARYHAVLIASQQECQRLREQVAELRGEILGLRASWKFEWKRAESAEAQLKESAKLYGDALDTAGVHMDNLRKLEARIQRAKEIAAEPMPPMRVVYSTEYPHLVEYEAYLASDIDSRNAKLLSALDGKES